MMLWIWAHKPFFETLLLILFLLGSSMLRTATLFSAFYCSYWEYTEIQFCHTLATHFLLVGKGASQPGVIPDWKARSKFWSSPGVAPKQIFLKILFNNYSIYWTLTVLRAVLRALTGTLLLFQPWEMSAIPICKHSEFAEGVKFSSWISERLTPWSFIVAYGGRHTCHFHLIYGEAERETG